MRCILKEDCCLCRRRVLLFFFTVSQLTNPTSWADEVVSAGSIHSQLPKGTTQVIAEQSKPTAEGAIGRNREAYFHVLFQLGMHRLAHHAIASDDHRALQFFESAVLYSLSRQREAGDFELQIPKELSKFGATKPSRPGERRRVFLRLPSETVCSPSNELRLIVRFYATRA